MKYLLILIALLGLLISCGKKGPIDLPTGYTDDRIPQVVKLDPPIVPEISGTNIMAFDLYSTNNMWVGFSKTKEIRSLIKYSLTGASDLTIATTTLSLKLTIDRLYISAPTTLHIYRLTKTWDTSSATWENSVTDTPWTTSGGDYTIDDAITVTVNPGDTDIDLSDAQLRPFITYWLDHSDENFGMIIVPDSAGAKDMEIISIISASTGTETTWPLLKYTVDTTEKSIYPTQQLHIYNNIGIVDTNDPGIFIIGDGYHPMISIDMTEFIDHPERKILQAKLIFSGDADILDILYDLNDTEDSTRGFNIALGTTESDGTFKSTYSFNTVLEYNSGVITLDISNAMVDIVKDDYILMVYLKTNKSMLRYCPITLDGLEIFYRDQIIEN